MVNLNFIITLIIALICGFALFKLKVPGGMMVGSILGAAAYNLITGEAMFPPMAKFSAQVIAGAFIGGTVRREDLIKLPKVIKSFSIIIFNFLILNIVLGFLIFKFSSLDLITSLMSTIPGGMSDTPLIAADLGANSSIVAALQFIRMSAGIGIFPSLIKSIDNRSNKQETKELQKDIESIKKKTNHHHEPLYYYKVIIVLLVGFAGGYIGNNLGIPAGTLVFSMLAIIILKLLTGLGEIPLALKRIAQSMAGAYVGSGIMASDLTIISQLLFPVILIILGYGINCILTGKILHKVFGMERKTAMLAATPAGASDMALISSEIGVVSMELNVLQILRLVVVISVFPQIIVFITNIF